ncbi:MAG: zinc ribbon domain-containing protein [Candidatus Hydrogenedentes bacterium]|nr:zinc ribbon domain-containing protein [Candidatus Hydrogenedentota bacterium]
MPTYTYECKKCGHEMDLFHSMTAAPRVKCEECGGSCRRLLGSGAGIIFKGSGFYETDYKTKSGKPPESSDKKTSGEEGGTSKKDSSKKDSTSKKSDSKAASKD